jgi:ATP-dependent RNA helicase DeaD
MTDLTFRDLWLSEEILKEIEAKGYTTPSLIQSQVIPVALSTDKDIIGQAQTWSGKTAAFWLPILDRIDRNSNSLEAIILTPTRELAIQVADELKSFTKNQYLNIVLLYWGQNIRTEMSALRNNPKIVVWTPWRVKDHLSKERLDLSNIKYFVLDEADEMLNVWFKEEIEEILEYSPKNKKTFLFSATMPPFIMNLVKNYLKDYELVSVKKENLTNDNIEQLYYEVPRGHKFEVLSRIIDITPDFYGIIFCRTKMETDEVASKLSHKWYKAEAIHWDIEQSMREKVLWRFKWKKVNILVATDVAARWIDVNDLTHVVNFELPDNPETYTHRIWRTGRAWKNGTAISLASSSDTRKLFFIERTIKAKIKKGILPGAKEIIEFKKQNLINNLKWIIENNEFSSYTSLAKNLLEVNDSETIISSLLFNFYAWEFNEETYKDLNSSDSYSRDRWERGERWDREPRARREDWMMRLFVAKWKMDWFNNPWNLLAFIGKETGLWDMWAGKVDIFTNFSYIDFPEDIASIILKIFKDKNSVKPLIVKAKERRDGDSWSSGRRDWGWYRWWSSSGRSSWYSRDRRSSSWGSSSWWSGYRTWNNNRRDNRERY